MQSEHTEMTVKLGFDVDDSGLVKVVESLSPLMDLVNALKDLERLGIRVRLEVDESRKGFVAN